jgi:hypothetical protein
MIQVAFILSFILTKSRFEQASPMKTEIVEVRGFEPLAFSLRTRRSTN